MKTLKEVLAIFPQTQREDWHQHENGKGWVCATATVDASAFVAGVVSGDARVFGDAQVFGNAQVFGDAKVFGDAWVYGNAQVSGNALVFGDAQVYGDAWEVSPLHIQGTRHSITLCSYGEIAIGCHVNTIDEWEQNYKTIGSKAGYTPEQIEEYGVYIALMSATAKRLRKKVI